ncbi:MAG: hypothetical protein MSS97_03855 [Arcanobacterium sp.]|nr:hypothetical protein [Arcanobacterium sp.]MDY6143394.1 hypothetical protein [Arcanobacterium sp.]
MRSLRNALAIYACIDVGGAPDNLAPHPHRSGILIVPIVTAVPLGLRIGGAQRYRVKKLTC